MTGMIKNIKQFFSKKEKLKSTPNIWVAFKGFFTNFFARVVDIFHKTSALFPNVSVGKLSFISPLQLSKYSKAPKVLESTKSPKISPTSLWSIIYFQGFLLVAIAAGGIWAYFTYFKAPAIDKNIPQNPTYVEAAPVEEGTFETFVTIMGTLRANQSILVRPEVEGKIKSIKFQTGDKVSKGDVLIEMDDAIYKAIEKESVAKVLLYKGKYERAEKLYEHQAGTLKEKEENFAQLKMAEADFDKAYNQRQKTIIRAPFDGIVGFKDISIGSYVRPGEDLVTLDELDPIKVDFRVGENMIDRIALGKKVELVVEGFLDNQFEATIEAIDPNVEPIGHSIRIRAALDNSDDLFKPGLFAKVKMMDTSHENIIMVPESAIENRGNRESVYVIENGMAKNVVVKVGNRNGEKVEILSGLKPGQVVVTAGQMRFRDKENPVIILPSNTLKNLM
ncbi:MAG: efflux RND transporter periplasmic adaptor subunit [Alphaproteobacteria bacterium]